MVNVRPLYLSLMLILAGCTPYASEFSCPSSYNGRCMSVQSAYDIAVTGKDGPQYDRETQKQKDSNGKDLLDTSPEEVAHTTYKESLFKRFDSLLKDPVTPVVAPPQVMRVLLLPYKSDSNELYMLRFVYFFVDEPRWILGDSLIANEED